MEDLDRPRVRAGAAEVALDDLRWLGLDWDEGPDIGGAYAPYTQSERQEIYAQHLHRLDEAGLLYPCYCSRTDIAGAASAPHGEADEGPRYPGTCRDPERREAQRRRAGSRLPALRFRVPAVPVRFEDGLFGPIEQNVAQSVGDIVVQRSDGVPAYHLAVVVDDALMRISDVVRGADLLGSTARQIALYRALSHPTPRFLHVPLAVDAVGQRLAKRHGAVGLAPLREAGCTPARAIGLLAASAGLVPAGTEITAQSLCAIFSLDYLRCDASAIDGGLV
jgi:glutamyl-tRNA synthetase